MSYNAVLEWCLERHSIAVRGCDRIVDTTDNLASFHARFSDNSLRFGDQSQCGLLEHTDVVLGENQSDTSDASCTRGYPSQTH